MYDFIAAYFLFLPVYPLAVIENFSRGPLASIVWLAIAILAIFLSIKFEWIAFKKTFIAIWVMPGTIVCGAATIAPWPLTVPYMFSEGDCVTIVSTLATLIFNFLLVFGSLMLINKFRNKNASA